MRLKMVFITLLLGLGILFPLATAQAQTELPEMNVAPFFNGYFKYGEWLPLEIELENPGQDLEVEIQVRIPRNDGGVTFSAPVSLPSGAHKRVTLYILPNNYSHSLDVNLVHDGDILVTKKVEVHPVMNINVVVGLVSSGRQALSLIKGVEYTQSMRPVEVVDMSIEQIPERYEGLRSFDVMVINDVDTSHLTPAQASALQSWVHNGGRLVLGGGAGAMRTLSGLPQDMLPGHISGEVKLEADELSALSEFSDGETIDVQGSFVCTQIEPIGETLLEDEGLVFISEIMEGAGFVDFVALDLSSPPFDGWAGTVEFWEALLHARDDDYNLPSDMSRRSMQASSLTYPLSNIPTMELPSFKWLAVILAIYIIIIGPVNYHFLKKKNRLHFAWITIPGITLLFSAAAFGSGYLMRGRDVIIHKIGVAEILTEDTASLTTYMGLFSPSQTSYQVEVSADGLLSPMQDDMSAYMGTGSSGETKMIQGDPAILSGLTVNQWSMQSFMTEQTWRGLGTISGELTLKDGKVVGTVKNETNQVLHDTTVVIRDAYQRLGDLEPGQETSVEVDLTTSKENLYQSVFYLMFQDDETGEVNYDAESDLKRSILSPLFENDMVFKVSSSSTMPRPVSDSPAYSHSLSNVLTFAWVDQVPPDVTVSSVTPAVHTTGLVYTYLDFKLPRSGMVMIPPGILQGNILETNAGMCGGMSGVNLYMNRDMKAQIEYQLPSREDYVYTELDLHISLDMPIDIDFLDLSLYDWQTKQWVSFKDVVVGTNMVRDPERFIAPDGGVQVQLNHSDESTVGGCVFFDMGFKAQGKGD